MSRKLRKQLYLASAFVFAVGLGSALFIYADARDDDSANAIGYEMVDGVAYPIAARDSKRYRHDLERLGGKAAILADDFSNWLSGLWHGKRLAFSVALISVVVSGLIFMVAKESGSDSGPDAQAGPGDNGTA